LPLVPQTISSPPPKCPTGIAGFDLLTGGGLPRGRTTLLLGGPGAGKTIFALEMLVQGAVAHHERGIFVAFEEDSRRIIANAASFGWDIERLAKRELYFLDVRLPPDFVKSGAFDLSGLLASVTAKAKEMNARRVVFDSVDVLLTLLNNPLQERLELQRLNEWLLSSELTCLITGKLPGADPAGLQGYPFMSYMVDCVVSLSQHVEQRVAQRTVRVRKFRGSSFAENEFPFCIGPQGIEVAAGAAEAIDHSVSRERVSTGVARLDTMLCGGYFRGSCVLISGSPGTAKSTLGGAFVAAACQRGEKGLYISFDETPGEIVRNFSSVGLPCERLVAEGKLKILGLATDAKSADEQLLSIRHLLRAHRPTALVVDPLSALIHSGGDFGATSVAQRLLRIAKADNVTVLCTSLLGHSIPDQEGTPLFVSALADTWIHLSYVARGGERNRALTIVKSRGSGHSNQVRELVLGNEGIVLADVYAAGGEVLMGTARWEKEQSERQAVESRRAEIARRRHEAEFAIAEAAARLETSRHEVATRRAEIDALQAEIQAIEQQTDDQVTDLRKRRGADHD
jgi:circadian clock protein KaiC